MATEKNEYGFKSRFLKWHILLVFSTSWILSFQWKFVYAAFVIAVTHWLIDGFKIFLNKNKRFGKYAYFIDQSLHLILIAAIVLIYTRLFVINPVFQSVLNTKALAAITAFLFCSKPANIVIKEIFHVFDIHINKNNTEEPELPNAGKLIGIIERWLVLIFILINQFEAVGFLIAAKSILRFKEDETLKTEYVLIGTMLSFAIAIAAGIGINLI